MEKDCYQLQGRDSQNGERCDYHQAHYHAMKTTSSTLQNPVPCYSLYGRPQFTSCELTNSIQSHCHHTILKNGKAEAIVKFMKKLATPSTILCFAPRQNTLCSKNSSLMPKVLWAPSSRQLSGPPPFICTRMAGSNRVHEARMPT